MAYKESNETLTVDINKEVYSAFQGQWKQRKQVRNAAAEAAIKLWTELTTEIQAQLMDESTTGNSLEVIVQQTIMERSRTLSGAAAATEDDAAAAKLAAKNRRSRSRSGSSKSA